MGKPKRYITFYKIKYIHSIPSIEKYGLMCSRNWKQCFKLGLRHIRQGKATFFTIKKVRSK